MLCLLLMMMGKKGSEVEEGKEAWHLIPSQNRDQALDTVHSLMYVAIDEL